MKAAKTKSKSLADAQNCVAPAPQPCPACGHCPTCGRGARTAPYIYPYTRPYPYWPTWIGTITVDGTAQRTATTYKLTPDAPPNTASASPSPAYDTFAVYA